MITKLALLCAGAEGSRRQALQLLAIPSIAVILPAAANAAKGEEGWVVCAAAVSRDSCQAAHNQAQTTHPLLLTHTDMTQQATYPSVHTRGVPVPCEARVELAAYQLLAQPACG